MVFIVLFRFFYSLRHVICQEHGRSRLKAKVYQMYIVLHGRFTIYKIITLTVNFFNHTNRFVTFNFLKDFSKCRFKRNVCVLLIQFHFPVHGFFVKICWRNISFFFEKEHNFFFFLHIQVFWFIFLEFLI